MLLACDNVGCDRILACVGAIFSDSSLAQMPSNKFGSSLDFAGDSPDLTVLHGDLEASVWTGELSLCHILVVNAGMVVEDSVSAAWFDSIVSPRA
jgi:hypothetical protein